MYRKRINNFNNRVHRIYDKKFSFIESVLDSCVTLDQLDNAACWASTVLEQYHKYEKDRLRQIINYFVYIDLLDVVNDYFGPKQENINLIFERKIEEVERQEVREEDEMLPFE